MPSLFDPIRIGDLDLPNRVLMAPLTRARATDDRVPTPLMIGAKDETSSPAACREMIEDARGRSALARIVVYPGADHAFDHPNDPRHALAAAPGAALPASVHAARTWDHEAHANSEKRLMEWLAR